ncbi:bestrophin-4-like isoform X2 [Argopecten irradians]|uniref:bestrophin-4-like isoform X2 n=1 Tax=Argopecten irradians TaxID=31199 RepID=UPI0037165A3A
MTIAYQYRVATARLGTFVKLLGIWKGSIYKLMYKEVLIFTFLYATISCSYRLALNKDQKIVFEQLSIFCAHYTDMIPVSFVLGFYVSLIVHRWWTQFMNVPWPDRTLFMTCCYLHGHDEKARIMRRSVARYMMFGFILITRSVSVAVMKRFPTLDHIVESGFISKEEAIMYEEVECKYNKFWVPIMWANSVLVQARQENKVETDWGLRMIIEQLADFRDKCSLCFVYDWITIPLVYTQVVTWSVYMFFAACLIGRQFLDTTKNYPGHEIDLYVPVFTLMQFFFYMGWLKVAEQLINPFGEDDDDFDINWLLDRHTAVAMTLVDYMYGKHPPLLRDMHFDEQMTELPYTEASIASRKPNFLGSTYNLAIPTLQEQRIISPEEVNITSHPRRRTSHGSNFAGSMLSLLTGRSSSQARFPPYLSHDYTDYRSVPNGHMDHFNHHLHHDRFVSVDMGLRSNGKGQGEFSSWSSDSELRKGNRLHGHFGRERSHTDANARDIEKDLKKERHRKVSFPLSLLRRLRSHSEKPNPGSSKSVHNDIDPDSTPEYVPLRRATIIQEANKRAKPNVDRKRKLSYPLGMLKRKHSDSSDGGGSTESTSAENVIPQAKPSRFTVEHIPDGYDIDESSHRRNAQIIEKAMAGKAVSRAPLLSAIEEGGTITSLTQILTSDEEDDAADPGRMELIPEIHEDPQTDTTAEADSTVPAQRLSFLIPTITVDDYS